MRIALDPALECPPALAPLIDPNEHSCGTVRPHGARELAQPEAGFYFAGMKSYGRAPTFLMLTGYEQVRSIVADIAGDREAAERVDWSCFSVAFTFLFVMLSLCYQHTDFIISSEHRMMPCKHYDEAL